MESMSQLEDELLSVREGRAPARDVRLPHRKEFFFALQNAIRIGVALSAGALFLVLAGWPASALALMITANVCALSTIMPDPSKAVVAAMASFALAAPSAGIVRFYLLTDSQDFIRLAIAIAPMMIFGCLLSVNPKIAGIGVTMNNIFLFLLAPSNPQSFNALSFLFAMHVRGICPRCRTSGVPPGVAGIGARQTTSRCEGDGGDVGGVSDRRAIQPAGAEHGAGLQDFRLCCRDD